MAERYVNLKTAEDQTHFERAVTDLPERSRLILSPKRYTTFNAGELVPIYCHEVLPSETIDMDVDFTIREVTMKHPVLSDMIADVYAFFVPNRVVNSQWKAVMGENLTNFSSTWDFQPPSLSSLGVNQSFKVPIGSIADHYGLPTQGKLPAELVNQMTDIPFRGYFRIFDEYFRDQNYQELYIGALTANTQSLGGMSFLSPNFKIYIGQRPLKVNKLHDYFTSVLPSPQRGQSVLIPASGLNPVYSLGNSYMLGESPKTVPLDPDLPTQTYRDYLHYTYSGSSTPQPLGIDGESSYVRTIEDEGAAINYYVTSGGVWPDNMWSLNSGIQISVEDIRYSSAIQRLLEVSARVGSRYREYLNGIFGIDVENPMNDIPTMLGHVRRTLETYQTAQTSASTGESPQGNLAGYSFTQNGGKLFAKPYTAVEHGYLHVFVVLRQKNIYPAFLSPSWFRLSRLDFYQPQLANISEQPVYTRSINPFLSDTDNVFGYQEAWAEYRDEPDTLAGLMRTGVESSFEYWHYGDNFDPNLVIADDEFMRSNAQEVVDRTVYVTSDNTDVFFGVFKFMIDKELPMPTYSIPELE